MVNEQATGEFDAAVDVMGFHMLVLDSDRKKYLSNVRAVLTAGAPMIFYKQAHRTEMAKVFDDVIIESFEQWLMLTGDDYNAKREMTIEGKTINTPFVPARGRTKEGFIKEFTEAGFVVDDFKSMEMSKESPHAATIWVHKH